MKRLATAVAFGWIVVGMAASIRANDDPDATGIWEWKSTPTSKANQTHELTLKRDGDTLTGSLFHYNSEFPSLPKSAQDQMRRNVTIEISDGMYQNGRLAFKITRTINGKKIETTYTGKIDGDMIKGNMRVGRISRPWQAKRVNH